MATHDLWGLDAPMPGESKNEPGSLRSIEVRGFVTSAQKFARQGTEFATSDLRAMVKLARREHAGLIMKRLVADRLVLVSRFGEEPQKGGRFRLIRYYVGTDRLRTLDVDAYCVPRRRIAVAGKSGGGTE